MRKKENDLITTLVDSLNSIMSGAGYGESVEGKVVIKGFGKGKQYEVAKGVTAEGTGGDVEFNSSTDIRGLFDQMLYNKDKRLLGWMKSNGLTDPRIAKEVWGDAATYAISLAKDGSTVDFFEVMNSDSFISTGLKIPAYLTGSSTSGGSGGPSSVSYINVTDPADARENLRKAMVDTLDRLPTEAEYKEYVQKLNASEKKYYKTTRYTDSTQTTTGREFDREGFLTGFVLSKTKFREDLQGQAGVVQDTVNQLIRNNGMSKYIGSSTARKWMRQLASGETDINALKANVREQALKVYKPFAELVTDGTVMGLDEIASPYLNVYASLLEKGEADIDVSDALHKAIRTDDKGQQSLLSTLDYEKAIRKDPRFQTTKLANQEAAAFGRAFAKSMGVNI